MEEYLTATDLLTPGELDKYPRDALFALMVRCELQLLQARPLLAKLPADHADAVDLRKSVVEVDLIAGSLREYLGLTKEGK